MSWRDWLIPACFRAKEDSTRAVKSAAAVLHHEAERASDVLKTLQDTTAPGRFRAQADKEMAQIERRAQARF